MSARNFIKLRGDLLDSPKVFQVAESMKCGHDTALGVLVRWLLWVDAHCVCDDTGLTPGQVDELLGRDGAMAAMEEIGWVYRSSVYTVCVCEFEKYLEPTAKQRQLAAERIAAHRWGKKPAKPAKPAKKGTAKKKGAKQ